jgi:hypothetical protein
MISRMRTLSRSLLLPLFIVRDGDASRPIVSAEFKPYLAID